MIKRGLNFFEESFLIVVFILFFLLSGYSKWALYKDISYVDIRFFKAGVFLMFVAGNFFLKNFKIFLLVTLMLIFYCIGQLFITESFSINSINILLKYIFLILTLSFVNNLHLIERLKPKLFVVFEWIMLLNSILIFVGILFSIRLFNTYQGNRFGYNGLFDAVSTGSYAYIITLIYFLLAYKSTVVTNWKFIIIFTSCIFIGTKAVYMTMLVALAYIIVNAKIPNKKYLLTSVVIFSLMACYFFFFQYRIFNTIRQSDGLISALLSYRNELLVKSTLPYIQKEWGWFNYLFGGVSNFDLRSQMEVIDVMFFWGLLGGLLYWVIFYRVFISFKLSKSVLFFMFFLTSIALFAGNFFTYSFVSLFLLVLKFIFEENSREFA